MDHPDDERRSAAVVHERVVGLGVLVVMMPRSAVVTVVPFGHGDVLGHRDREALVVA